MEKPPSEISIIRIIDYYLTQKKSALFIRPPRKRRPIKLMPTLLAQELNFKN